MRVSFPSSFAGNTTTLFALLLTVACGSSGSSETDEGGEGSGGQAQVGDGDGDGDAMGDGDGDASGDGDLAGDGDGDLAGDGDGDLTGDGDGDSPVDEDGDGFSADEDCDDQNEDIHPDATEACDGVDNDCDDEVDEGLLITSFPDEDGDGHGDGTAAPMESCTVPDERVEADDDCDDADESIYPGSLVDRCDAVDTDCDGQLEELVVSAENSLEDALGAATSGQRICIEPGTYVAQVEVNLRVRIEGMGTTPEEVVLDGDGAGSILRVNDPADGTEIRNLTVSGAIAGWGAGIHALADVSLDEVVIAENSCAGACLGAGLYIGAGVQASVTRSLIRDNVSTSTQLNQQLFGGGIFSQGTLVLEDSVVMGNRIEGPSSGSTTTLAGAGLHSRVGLATVTRVLFVDNRITGDYIGIGAGIDALSTLVIDQVEFRGNSLETGYTYGAAWSTRGGTTTATNVVAAGNSSTANAFNGFGGTVMATSILNLTNATFAGNSMTSVGNTNGCVLRSSGSTMTLTNVIFESNVCDEGEIFSQQGDAPTVDSISVFGHAVPAGLTPVLTDSASFVDTTADPQDWDLHLSPTSLLRNAGSPALSNPDGTRSDLGAYGGPGGDFSVP